MKFHISNDGIPRKCSASIRECKFGGVESHYPTMSDALKSYENKMSNKTFMKINKNNKTEGLTVRQQEKLKLALSTPKITYDNPYEKEYFENLRNHFETITLNGVEIAIQNDSEDESSQFCTLCYTPLNRDHGYLTGIGDKKCPECSTTIDHADDVMALLKREDLKYLDEDTVLATKWYHVTQKEGWGGGLNGKNRGMVHLGSRQAALDRLKTLNASGDSQYYLYEVELDNASTMAPQVQYDDPIQYVTVEELREDKEKYSEKIDLDGVTRYVNHYEDPGSISLIVNPKTIKVRNVSAN